MLPLSIIIVTKDEEKNIGEALESIKGASEIVILDAFSTDRTLEICREYTDKIYQVEWQGYARQKQKAIEFAKGPWIFILDSDERFTESLWEEITNTILNNNQYSGFYLPRKNFFLSKWIKHGGWWPDYTLRLFIKEKAFVEDRRVHEKVAVNGKVGYLKNHLKHYTYRTISDYIKKMDRYSSLSAEELKGKGVGFSMSKLIFHPLSTFSKMFFLRQGFMDGIHGFILATLYSFYTFLKYLKLWEMSKKE
ncbi:MAG: glycosyltransferase family 2 protein [Nitrospirota bacterium]